MSLLHFVNLRDCDASCNNSTCHVTHPYPAETLVVVQRFILEGQLPAKRYAILPTLEHVHVQTYTHTHTPANFFSWFKTQETPAASSHCREPTAISHHKEVVIFFLSWSDVLCKIHSETWYMHWKKFRNCAHTFSFHLPTFIKYNSALSPFFS